jgi:uncharacterized protein (TIGR02646 family)
VIRIRKPATPPEVLRTKGARARRTLSAAYSRQPQAYASGTKSFKIDSDIYGHASVKQALLDAQHGKCAFCESKIAHIAYGDVEHFRPKAGCRQQKGHLLERPGYYWLAYEWTNLFLACTLCNQQFKRNLFPLSTPTRRARSHQDDITAEDPLLIDPAQEDPEALISFRQEVPYAVGGNARGAATIDALGLQREALAEQRRDRLAIVATLRSIIDSGLESHAAEARRMLDDMRKDSAQYASMTRAFLRAAPSSATT